MADFNEIKGSVISALGTAAGKTKIIANKAADKAKDVSRITKLNLEIKAAKDTVEKAYSEIGKIYYDTHKNCPDDYFVQLCTEITNALQRIEALEIEVDKVKVGTVTSDDGSIEVEFTEVHSDEAATESDFAKPEEDK